MTEAAQLSVSGLAVGYDGEAAPVLAGVDFELPAGDCLAVVGRSGCGKSTLLHVLAGLLAPESGVVMVDGAAVAASERDGTKSPGSRAGHAAYMFQQDLLLPWKTALGNATFAARMAKHGSRSADLEEQARRLLLEFGLGDALTALPAELSGGMRQRVALARTMVMDRGLILLDEPFGSLDAVTRAEMRRWLLDVMAAHPATWVLVTHDVDEAVLLGDHVAVLDGRPARLEGWTGAALSREQRRGLAAADAGEDPAAGPAASPGGREEDAAHPGPETLAAAGAAVRGLLRSRAGARA